MSDNHFNYNALFLTGIKNRDYRLIQQAIDGGAPCYEKNTTSNKLLFKSWGEIISLGDIGIIELIYNCYPFKPGYHFQNLLTSIIVKNKEAFDFFLDKSIKSNVNLNDKFGILLSNTCKISAQTTYEENFEKKFISDYFLNKLLEQNIDLTVTTLHPLAILAQNNNFHSWKLLYDHIKKDTHYDYKMYEKSIIHSLYAFLDNQSFLSQEVQFFFQEFDSKTMFVNGLKKVSHPSYKGNDLNVFCLEMFSQEPDLFIKKSKTLGKNNEKFSSTIQKIILFDKLDVKLIDKKTAFKGNKI